MNLGVDVDFDGDIVLSNPSGQFVSSQPVTFNVQQNGLIFKQLQINRAEIVLPSTLQTDHIVTLNYRLSSTEAKPPEDTVPTLTATPANGAVTLNWTPVEKATGYNIKKGLRTGEDAQIMDAKVQGTSFVDKPLDNGTTYYYWVSASIPDKIGQNSNEASATPAALPELVSAASRKAHGTVDYDISITKPSTKGSPAGVP